MQSEVISTAAIVIDVAGAQYMTLRALSDNIAQQPHDGLILSDACLLLLLFTKNTVIRDFYQSVLSG